MYKFLLIILFTIFCTPTFSSDWVSPIDRKYLARNPELFSKFSQVRDILNSWGGQNEKLRNADKLLKEILSQDNEFAPAYREYGRLFIMAGYINYDNFKKGSLNPSESSILRSIEIEPKYADSYVLLGHLYTNMKRYEEAKTALLKAEEIGTEIPWLHLNWADLLEKQGQYTQAMRCYQHVVKAGTDNRKAYASALSAVTTMYSYMKQYDKANEGYKKEIEYSPDNAWTWGNYSSFLLFTYNDIDGAIEKGKRALTIMNYGMGRFTLACALYTKWALLKKSDNNSVQAQKYFDQAWAIYPYPKKVIAETKQYEHTRITATMLQKWLTTKRSS